MDAPPRVAAEGGDSGLRPRKGHGFFTQFMQGHAEQGDGLLFAGGHQHVKFTFARRFRQFLGKPDQLVRHAAHGGNDGDHLVAFPGGFMDAARYIADAVNGADGAAPEFLNDKSHVTG